MIGWTNLEGLWLVDGANADRLGVGSSVVMYATADGERLTFQDQLRLGSQALTELGWAGSAALGDTVDPKATYEVLWPMGPNCVARDDMPATSRAEFERDMARTAAGLPVLGPAGVVSVGTAACEHPGPQRVERHAQLGA